MNDPSIPDFLATGNWLMNGICNNWAKSPGVFGSKPSCFPTLPYLTSIGYYPKGKDMERKEWGSDPMRKA